MGYSRFVKTWLRPSGVIVRYGHYMRGKPPPEAKSLEQVLRERNAVDPEVSYKVNIGLPPPKLSRKAELEKWIKKRGELEKLSREKKLEVPLEQIKEEWKKQGAPQDIKLAAEHYGIFDHLFGDAYFIPYIYIDIAFPQDDGKLAPVYRGNVVKPAEASQQPFVNFESDKSDFWTLILTNPDGHLTEENKEYVHWMVGNIPSSDLSKGEVLFNYMQPFPALGVGFQRFIFVLYKQSSKIDYSSFKDNSATLDLSKRTFSTLEFYRARQDELTPAGLAFFQSDWDSSVRQYFHQRLNMEEPTFEYDHDPLYLAPQKWFPKRKAFNMYLDKFRDPKDIAKDFLLKKLEKTNPFERPRKPFPFPNIYKVDRTKTPTWLLTEQRRVKLGLGRINHQKDE